MQSVETYTHSQEFVSNWKALLCDVFGYREHDQFIIVRDYMYRKVYSYLPLLNYTDKTSEELQSECKVLGHRRYIARALNPEQDQLSEGDTVTMRLSLTGVAHAEALWDSRFSGKVRNQIRKSLKSDLRHVVSTDPRVVDDFYLLYTRRMLRYGSPCLGREIFDLLSHYVDCRFYVVYHGADAIAGLVLIRDGPLAWVPWASSDHRYNDRCPNHFMYWHAIRDAWIMQCELFDFGRSPYLRETYRFKLQWGAQPVKLDILKAVQEDTYRKYALASQIWRRLPAALANRLGPVLCRHLPDL